VTGTSAAGIRSVLCVVSAAALLVGCSGERRARQDHVPSDPGAPTVVPTAGGGSPSPARSPHVPGGLPDRHRIDQKDATAVSRAALTVMYTVDSTVDTGLRDARLRAAGYLTSGYTTVVEGEPEQYVPEEWRRHRAYLAVRLRPLVRETGAPPDRRTAAYRQWEMTTVPTGRDRWRGSSSASVVFMSLARSSERAPWRVSDVTVVDDG
jgi:hypothetical protein